MPPDLTTLLSIDDVMARLDVGRTTARRLLDGGELASVKIGRRRLIPEDSLRAYVARLSGQEREKAGAGT